MSVRTLNKTIDNYDGSSDEDIDVAKKFSDESAESADKVLESSEKVQESSDDSPEEAEIRELLGSAPQFGTRTQIHADLFSSAHRFGPRTTNINFDIAFPPSEILQEVVAEIEHHFQESELLWANSSRNVLEDLQNWSCQKQGEVVSDEDVDFAHLFSDESDESVG